MVQKKYLEAESNLQKALEIFKGQAQSDPTNVSKKTYFALTSANLGEVYFTMSKFSNIKKLKHLRQAETLYQESIEIFSTLQNSLSLTNKKKADEVGESYKQILSEISRSSNK